jgi:hypothetical protein
MARVLPTPLPQYIVDDPKRAAEREVYVGMQRLPADVHVYYCVAWLARRRTEGARDGEADCVVVERDRGILVVEVKGGQIARDGTTGRWTSRDTTGAVHVIGDPVAQARTSHHALIEKLRSHFRHLDTVRIGGERLEIVDV